MSSPRRVHRVEVRPREGMPDVRGERLLARIKSATDIRDAHAVPVSVRHASVYLLEGDLDRPLLSRVATELLADPVMQQATILHALDEHMASTSCAEQSDAHAGSPAAGRAAIVEIHPLPGVMDPAAESVESAIHAITRRRVRAHTADRYDLTGVSESVARSLAERHLANTVIHAVHTSPQRPERLPEGRRYELSLREIPLSTLDDTALERLSREAHLFLSLEEMRAIRDEYRRLGREPREIELETLAQTWSEHCVHKTLKSTIRYREAGVLPPGSPSFARFGAEHASGGADDGPNPSPSGARGAARHGHEPQSDGSVIIRNLLRSTVAAATHELIAGRGPGGAAGRRGAPQETGAAESAVASERAPSAEPIVWCLSVFVDNAGVIAFDERHAVCFKVETHNHPSAIEPYGGAATGIGGCIRDVMGTGLAAKPIAATDVFCVAPLETGSAGGASLPQGCLPPARVLDQVVSGVRDYANRMGIPTLNGAVWFDERYVGNPLVFCGTVGVLPRNRIRGAAQAGDRIVAIGGRTGRDGIHGATFSSAELTDAHADEFGHAVQIGNAITEKKCLDALLAARDHADGPLFHAVTDCGAGGFSSAVGEMGSELGAEVHLDRAPLKYEGLSPTEVWISEAQERMVLAVPQNRIEALRAICEMHEVELSELGDFGTPDRTLRLRWHGTDVGRLDMHFLHDGIPTPTREALWDPSWGAAQGGVRAGAPTSKRRSAGPAIPWIDSSLRALLAHPNIASREWIIRRYDHEVQGGSVIKPLVGERADGPSDAAVILPVSGSRRGLAIGNGLATGLCADPYLMGLAAIDECVRNLVCVGADPNRIAILDNFCWPSCKDERNLGSLVRAAEACYDGAHAYRTPFISGKDSLNNQFVAADGRVIQVPPTLLISGFGIVEDVERCVTMDLKRAGNLLVLVGETHGRLGGSHWLAVHGLTEEECLTGRGEWLPPSADFSLPRVDLERGPRTARAVAKAIAAGLVRSAHDPSEGGLLVAVAEMAMAGGLGCSLDLATVPVGIARGAIGAAAPSAPKPPAPPPPEAIAFAEDPSRYLLEVEPEHLESLGPLLANLPWAVVGKVADDGRLSLSFDGSGGAADGAHGSRDAVTDRIAWTLDDLRERWLHGAELS